MIAVVILGGSPLLAVWAVGLLIAVGVLVAHLGAYRPKVKRMAVAVVVAAVLSTAALQAAAIVDPCQQYEPWSPLWVLAGCYLPW